jgi:hypothetical protein
MTTHAERIERLPVTSGRLWAGVLLAPTAWMLFEFVGYYVDARGCEFGVEGIPLAGTAHPAVAHVIMAVVALVAAVVGLFVSIGNWRAVASNGERAHWAEWGRARFMAYGGIILSVLFIGGIVLFAISPFFIKVCSQAR